MFWNHIEYCRNKNLNTSFWASWCHTMGIYYRASVCKNNNNSKKPNQNKKTYLTVWDFLDTGIPYLQKQILLTLASEGIP